MPYSSVKDLPAEVKKKYTSKQQRAFRQAFNSALKDGKSEEQAFKIAHAAARRASDKKSGDKAMSVKCPTCPRQFMDEASLVDHAESVHTLSEKRALVSRAVRATHGKDAYMVDLSDDWLIYDIYAEGEYKLYKQSYALDNSGNVKISGDPKEVVRKIAYIPAPKIEVASASLSVLDIALATAVMGVPPSDAPHQFAQEDPAFDPNICTDCGRHKVHALHTNTADKADEQAAIEASQATIELSKQGKKSDSKKAGSGNDTFICPTCKDKFPSDGDLKDHRKKKGH